MSHFFSLFTGPNVQPIDQTDLELFCSRSSSISIGVQAREAGGGGLQPTPSGATLVFFGHNPAAKNEKYVIRIY